MLLRGVIFYRVVGLYDNVFDILNEMIVNVCGYYACKTAPNLVSQSNQGSGLSALDPAIHA
jgi:hypothetical protein